EVGELLSTRHAPRRPEVNEQRTRARIARAEQRLEFRLFDLRNLRTRRSDGRGPRVRLFLRRRPARALCGGAGERGDEQSGDEENLSHLLFKIAPASAALD